MRDLEPVVCMLGFAEEQNVQVDVSRAFVDELHAAHSLLNGL